MTELLIASNALLWVCVLGLGVGYFALLRRGPEAHHDHGPTSDAAGMVGSRIEVPSEIATALDESGSGVILFASPGCPPCEALHRELRRGWPETSPLVVISTTPLDLGDRIRVEVVNGADGESLNEQLGVRDHPFAWVVQSGIFSAGGTVNTVAQMRELVAVSSTVEAASR